MGAEAGFGIGAQEESKKIRRELLLLVGALGGASTSLLSLELMGRRLTGIEF